MKKWLVPLIVLAISLAFGGIVTGFTLSGGSGTQAQDLAEQVEEPTVCNAEYDISTCTQEELYELGLVGPAIMKGPFPFVAPITGGDGGDVTSIDDTDPTVCNAVHNMNACTHEELEELGVAPHGDPTYDKWLSDFGDENVVTSIDDIDPSVCNAVHNINACTQEELEELGLVGPGIMKGPFPLVNTATPTPTPTANPTTITLPQRPLIRLRHDGQVYSGVAGTSCWPVETGVSLCGDEGPLPWEIVDRATGESCPSGASWCGTAVPVPMGDSIIVEIDADDQPNSLQVAIYDNASKAHSDPPA